MESQVSVCLKYKTYLFNEFSIDLYFLNMREKSRNEVAKGICFVFANFICLLLGLQAKMRWLVRNVCKLAVVNLKNIMSLQHSAAHLRRIPMQVAETKWNQWFLACSESAIWADSQISSLDAFWMHLYKRIYTENMQEQWFRN